MPNSEAKKDFVSRCILGRYYDWQEPKIKQTFGPYFPSAFADYSSSIENVKSALSQHLNTLSENELHRLSQAFDRRGQVKANPPEEYEKFVYLVDEVGHLHQMKPVWFAGGFGHSDYQIDIEYWSKLSHYLLDELLLLSLGIDPNKANVSEIVRDAPVSSERIMDVAEYLANRSRIFARQFNPDGDGGKKITPISYLKFVDFFGIEADQNFILALRKIHHPDFQRDKVDAKFDPREKATLLRMIAIMAWDGYGFRNQTRPKLFREISEMGRRNGINLSVETIRKHVKSASKLVIEPWKVE